MCALALQVAWLERSFHDDTLFLRIQFNRSRDFFGTKPRACVKRTDLELVNETSRQRHPRFEGLHTY